ncbi:MAG: AAA family ATPase [Chryseobacterium culicis]
MIINTIDLINFRNFENTSFNFNSQFTVVIGENGKGKSSILQGLRIAAGTFLMGIDEAERYHIQKEDVRRIDLQNRFIPQKGCSIKAYGFLNDQEIEWKRSKTSSSRTNSKDANDIIKIAESINKSVNEDFNDEVDLPVINFFSTSRLWVEPKQTVKLKKKGSKLKDGYARCIDSRSDKKSPMEWIKSTYYKSLKGRTESVLLDAVLEAIDICIPHWTPKEWDEDSDDLGGVLSNEDGQASFIPLFYLSDGLRTMAAMVAEIAYRCVVLNPHLGRDAVKKSKGIVLIDEIDMHLHPKWQQSVVNDLKTAFPNIQFIATTHSPFIVQSLKADELINLDAVVEEDPIKMSIQDVASHIMKVEPRSLEYQKTFDNTTYYLELLNKINLGDDYGIDHGPTIEDQLDELEKQAEINDPAVAAFFKMNRLALLGSDNDKRKEKE